MIKINKKSGGIATGLDKNEIIYQPNLFGILYMKVSPSVSAPV